MPRREALFAFAVMDGGTVWIQEEALNLRAGISKALKSLIGVLLANKVEREATHPDLASSVEQPMDRHIGDELRTGRIDRADIRKPLCDELVNVEARRFLSFLVHGSTRLAGNMCELLIRTWGQELLNRPTRKHRLQHTARIGTWQSSEVTCHPTMELGPARPRSSQLGVDCPRRLVVLSAEGRVAP